MATPGTVLRNLITTWTKALSVLATDGGAEDGKFVELTGTSDGALNVSLGGAAITIGEVDQGAKADAATDAWYTQLVTAAGVALLGRLAAASSLPVVLSTEDAAKVPSLGQAVAGSCVPVVLPSAQAGGALALDATLTGGTAKAKVTEQPCTIAGVGQKTSGASAAVTSGVSGAGYLTILNTDDADPAYLGTGTVDNTKFLLSPGASVTWPISDVTTVNCFGSGAILSWAFLQVA